MTFPRRLVPLALAVAVLSGCTTGGSADPSASPGAVPSTASPSPTGLPPQLVELGSFSSPVWVGPAPGDAQHLFLAEKTGRVLQLDRNGRVQRTVLDLRPQLSRGTEQGLLSIAFDPGFARNKRMYAYFTDKAGDNRLQAFTVFNGVAIVPQDLVSLPRPYPNHNGGALLFAPDGALLLGTGDGGSAGDPDDRAQNPVSLFGKVLRLDPMTGAARAGNPYPNNARVWATGLRQPWRMAFDTNGDLYVGDVGQSRREELNVVPPAEQSGANFGWSVLEGELEFKPGAVLRGSGPRIDPALVYDHTEGGCSIVGGEVYRGKALPSLTGSYVFGDYCLGRLWATTRTASGLSPLREVGVRVDALQAFGHDHDGELLVMSAEKLFRLGPPLAEDGPVG